MKKTQTDRFESVWDAIADTPEEAANLRVRSELMDKISELIAANGWTQPRISDLLRGRLSRFSLDALVNIAAALRAARSRALEAA